MELETINKLFLELSQFATATTAKELKLEWELVALKGTQEPMAWMWQHEDTGMIGFVDLQQIANGFESNNPRLKLVSPLYPSPPNEKQIKAAALREAAEWFDNSSDKQCYLAAPNLRLMAEEIEK